MCNHTGLKLFFNLQKPFQLTNSLPSFFLPAASPIWFILLPFPRFAAEGELAPHHNERWGAFLQAHPGPSPSIEANSQMGIKLWWFSASRILTIRMKHWLISPLKWYLLIYSHRACLELLGRQNWGKWLLSNPPCSSRTWAARTKIISNIIKPPSHHAAAKHSK